jgi:hypothetical protein
MTQFRFNHLAKNAAAPTDTGRSAGGGARWRAARTLAASLALSIVSMGAAEAGIVYTGGVGLTAYGVTNYNGGAQGTPQYLTYNNTTGFYDLMNSPGGVYQDAYPTNANTIRFYPPSATAGSLPFYSFQIGGGNGNGNFGAGAMALTGLRTTFRLSDSAPGSGEASFEVASWSANFTVGAGGYSGNLGTYLAIGGTLPDGILSTDAASLVSHYYVNGVLAGTSPAEILAASGNGAYVALGGGSGTNAAIVFGPGDTSFVGLAVDSVPATLAAGAHVTVWTTLTVYADPASIDSIPITPDLLSETGLSLPSGTILGDVAGSVPEPSAWALAILGAGLVGWRLRSRRLPAAAV